MSLVLLLSLLYMLNGIIHITLEEIGPSQMLIYLIVVFIMVKSGFVRSLSLNIVLVLLIEKSNLQKGVDFTFNSKSVG